MRQVANAGRSGSRLLHAAINNFLAKYADLPEHEKVLLRRLKGDHRAAKAFGLVADQSAAEGLLLACLEGAEFQKQLPAQLVRSKRLLGTPKKRGELERLEAGLVAFESFVRERQSVPPSRLLARHNPPPGELIALKQLMAISKDFLATERMIAEETPARLGVTRKTGKGSAEVAAIGWIAEGVRRATKNANTEVAALLAGAVLDRDLSKFRTRAAERTRAREWRVVPLGVSCADSSMGTLRRKRTRT